MDRSTQKGCLHRKIPVRKKEPVVGITWGDPAGVGPELASYVFRKLGRCLPLRRVGHGESRPGKPSLAGAKLAKEALALQTETAKLSMTADQLQADTDLISLTHAKNTTNITEKI